MAFEPVYEDGEEEELPLSDGMGKLAVLYPGSLLICVRTRRCDGRWS